MREFRNVLVGTVVAVGVAFGFVYWTAGPSQPTACYKEVPR